MSIFSNEKRIRSIFVFSVELKAINAVFEIILGIGVLFTDQIRSFIQTLDLNELIEDPNSMIATYAQHFLRPLTIQTEHFLSAYLLSHGIIKLFLAVGLLRNKLWAYPSAIIVFALFIVYQIYRYLIAPSFFLVALTIFDIAIIVLTWHEYQFLKNQSLPESAQNQN
ncbi:MAG: DUF2127 domain-containing protein [bacterium]|nr:DUF2127 domain-containing protein [bacterium]